MKKWEYKCFSDGLSQSYLNELGYCGWELVSHSCLYVPTNRINPVQYYVFKRELLTR